MAGLAVTKKEWRVACFACFFSILVLHVSGFSGSGNFTRPPPAASETHSRVHVIRSSKQAVFNTWKKFKKWTASTPEGRGGGAASHLHILGHDGKMSDSVVLYGGEVDDEGYLFFSNTTWIYTPSTNSWRFVPLSRRDPFVYGHTMVTMCNQTIFLFGGVESIVDDKLLEKAIGVTNRTWSFDGISWSKVEVEIQDTVIEPRAYHAAVSVYQELSHDNCECKESMLVFGGGNILRTTLLNEFEINENLLYDGLWELRCVETGYRWFRLTPDDNGNGKPSKRYSPAATSINDVMYMFGGCRVGGLFGCLPKTDLWTYNSSSIRWRRLLESSFPSHGLHHLVYLDRPSYRSSNRITGLFLCCTKPFYFFNMDTEIWQELDFLGTDDDDYKDLVEASVAAVRGNVFIFGGQEYPTLIVQKELWKITMLQTDTCLLTKKSQDTISPIVRGTQVAVVDRHSDIVIAHGGLSVVTMFVGADYSERNTGVWLFDLQSRTWSVRRPSERLSRIGHVGALLSYPDTVLVVFGGFSSSSYTVQEENSTWGFYPDKNTWIEYVTIDSQPKGRRAASATAISDRSIIMFGGVTDSKEILNDTWMFTLTDYMNVSNWTRIVAQESPRRFGHTAVLVSNQILLYGGGMGKAINSSGSVAYLLECSDELWNFDLSRQQWQRIFYDSNGPGPRCFHSATGNGEKMIVAGGCEWPNNLTFDDLYLYDMELEHCQSSDERPRVWYFSVTQKMWSEMDSLPFKDSVFIEGKLLLWGDQNIVAFGGYSVPMNESTATYDYQDWYAAGFWYMTAGCPAGTEAQNFWYNTCDTCPQGYFSEFNARHCNECPVGFTTPNPQATNKRNCTLCDQSEDFCDHGACYVQEELIARDMLDRECRCNDGYTRDHRGKCTIPTVYVASIGAFVAVVLICCVVFLYIRYTRARKLEMRRQQMELAALNQVWRIKASEIVMGERIDGDSPGGFGEVYKAEYRELTVAVKKLHSVHTGIGRYNQEFEREIKVMRTLRHPNIVLFFGGGHFENNVDGSRSPFLVVEYMPRGSLGAILRDKNMPLDDKQKLDFALDAAEGMAFLHSLRPPRIHRDLKSYNLLVSDRWTVKVADFGAARLVKQEGICQAAIRDKDAAMTTPLLEADALLSTDCGSLLWSAPELLERKDYGTPVDVYSFGIVLWEIWERQLPYVDHDSTFSYQIHTLVCEGIRPTIPNDNEWPADIISLMRNCWCHHPNQRPTFVSVVKKLKDVKDML